MISVCIEAQASARPAVQARNAADEHAPEFQDVLRQEEAAREPEGDGDPAPPETLFAAGCETPPALPTQSPVQPVSLHALLAQVVHQLPSAASSARDGEAKPVAEPKRFAPMSERSAIEPFAVAPEKEAAMPHASGVQEDELADTPGENERRAVAAAPAPVGAGRHEGRGAQKKDASAATMTRAVAVRHVTSAVHFPVVADPVRQIVNEVARALAEPSPTPASSVDALETAQPVKTLHLQLEPESLGSVTLRLRLSGNQLSVRVDVAEPATLDMIQREQDRLQKSMSGDQIALERFEIRAAPESAPIQPSESASQTRADTYAPGQQSRAQGEAPGGQGGRGRENRREPGSALAQRDKHESVSNRSSAHRGLYL